MSVRIDIPTLDDCDALLHLQEVCVDADDRCPRRTWRRVLMAPERMRVLREGGAIIGAAVWMLRAGSVCARLRWIGIAPAHRRAGHGRRLLRAACAALPASITAISLEVRIGNRIAIDWYRRLGLRPCAGLAAYYADGEDGIRMRGTRAECERVLRRKA